jgi:diguanylate cyclase (GGDEF)-like protein
LSGNLGGAVPDKHEGLQELAGLFAEFGVSAFLETTSTFVTILDQDGKLLRCNPSFAELQQKMPEADEFRDFLSLPGQALFDQFLKNTLAERVRYRANLEFAWDNRWDDFSAIFIPLPGQRVLLIAEPVQAVSDFETISAELQKIKRSLTMKETELKAVIAQANEVSHTDWLTFLPNRRQIIGDLQREIIFADRYGTPLSISLLDIDFFKKINDTYGHVTGDDVLRKLAGDLREHIRHPDTIGRYGGEEFLVVLPHSAATAASEQADRLCKHVRSLVIPSNGQKITLTISVGIAQYKIHQEDWQSFLSRADRALYQAKNDGRNQWMVSEG